MKHRFMLFVGVAVVALTVTSSALAFDCMRVSSSPQGLQRSAGSGNWLYFDMTDSGNGVAEIAGFVGVPADAVPCLQEAYDAAVAQDPTLPVYFALGIGVAGGRTGHGAGVLAHNNPNARVLSNGTGIDHFDDTVEPVFEAAAPTCLGA